MYGAEEMEYDMYEKHQIPAIMFCPFSLAEEEVFAHIAVQEGQQVLIFDGRDHQYHECNECLSCWKNAKDKFIGALK